MIHTVPAPLLSVVIVSWESGKDLVECVRSLAGAAAAIGHERLELIVVDNGSRDFPAEEVRRVWAPVLLIGNPENRGFGPAANQGAGRAGAPMVLFLNPDTRADGEPFGPLLEAFQRHPDAVAVAPRLLESGTAADETQAMFQLRRLPTWRQALGELLLLDRAFPRRRALLHRRYADRDREQPFEVEQPAAAALAVRREAFLKIGGFDEAFVPAWFEDVDLCARLAPLGSLLYWPDARFVHAGGAAARALGYDRFLPIYYRNAIRYWRKHRGPLAASAFHALVAAGMGLRLLILPLRPRVPRPRSEAGRAYLWTLQMACGLGGGRSPAARA